jgi:hypothetical protein
LSVFFYWVSLRRFTYQLCNQTVGCNRRQVVVKPGYNTFLSRIPSLHCRIVAQLILHRKKQQVFLIATTSSSSSSSSTSSNDFFSHSLPPHQPTTLLLFSTPTECTDSLTAAVAFCHDGLSRCGVTVAFRGIWPMDGSTIAWPIALNRRYGRGARRGHGRLIGRRIWFREMRLTMCGRLAQLMTLSG